MSRLLDNIDDLDEAYHGVLSWLLEEAAPQGLDRFEAESAAFCSELQRVWDEQQRDRTERSDDRDRRAVA